MKELQKSSQARQNAGILLPKGGSCHPMPKKFTENTVTTSLAASQADL